MSKVTMKTYEMTGGTSYLGNCTCGSCRQALRDAHGNVDYGQRWSDERSTYLIRRGPDGPCEIAAKRARAR